MIRRWLRGRQRAHYERGFQWAAATLLRGGGVAAIRVLYAGGRLSVHYYRGCEAAIEHWEAHREGA